MRLVLPVARMLSCLDHIECAVTNVEADSADHLAVLVSRPEWNISPQLAPGGAPPWQEGVQVLSIEVDHVGGQANEEVL